MPFVRIHCHQLWRCKALTLKPRLAFIREGGGDAEMEGSTENIRWLSDHDLIQNMSLEPRLRLMQTANLRVLFPPDGLGRQRTERLFSASLDHDVP